MKKIILLILLLPLTPLMALDYSEENKIAQDYISALEAANLIVHEHELQWRLQDMTNQLAASIDNPYYQFKVYLVRDRSVNAFAIPDGHIFINLGTILAAEDLDEISSVIAHEMGHCQLRHIARKYESGKKVSAASIVGMLAGILATASNPEIGTALIMSSLGGAQNIQLKYSREHEYEADEFGRNVMQKTGLDASAQNRFMVSLHKFSGNDKIPEYFLTHPKSTNRISAIQSEQGKAKPDRRFWELQAISIGLLMGEEETLLRAKHLPEPHRSLAEGLMRANYKQNEQAIELLKDINLPIARAHLGLAYYNAGDRQRAYHHLENNHNTANAALALAEIQAERGDLNDAIRTLSPYTKHHPRVPYNLGTYYEKVGNTALMHASYAQYFYSIHSFSSCSYHLNEALKYEDQLDKGLVNQLQQMLKIVKKAQQSAAKD